MPYRNILSPSSKVNSNSSSRPSSRGPSAANDENELLNDINFGNLDELISERLNTLLNLDSGDDADASKREQTVRLKLSSIPEIIKTLQKSRSEVSSNDRELLLNQLHLLIIKNADLDNVYDDYDYEVDLIALLKIFQTAKSSNESILATRVLTSFIIANIDNAGVLYSEDKSLNILQILEKKIRDETISNDIKQHLIHSYSSIALAIHDDSGGYGVDDSILLLTDVISESSGDLVENANIIASASYGLGALLTILTGGENLNETVETILDNIVDIFLDSDLLEVIKPVAMLIGLSYELYNYDDDISDDLDEYDDGDDIMPYNNTYELKSRLELLIRNSSKKISKKDKKEGRSLFKDVLTTLDFYSDKKSRLNKLLSKKNDEGEFDQNELVLSHIKLSKSRSLAVKSWFAFFRLIQLKWVFGTGIHTQLANNSQISNIVRDKPATDYATKFSSNANTGTDDIEGYWNDEKTKKLTDKKKHKDLENKRLEKLNVTLDQAGILDEK